MIRFRLVLPLLVAIGLSACRDEPQALPLDVTEGRSALTGDPSDVLFFGEIARPSGGLNLSLMSSSSSSLGGSTVRSAAETYSNVTFEGIGHVVDLTGMDLQGGSFPLWRSLISVDSLGGSHVPSPGNFRNPPSKWTAAFWFCQGRLYGDNTICPRSDYERRIELKRPVKKVSFKFTGTAEVNAVVEGSIIHPPMQTLTMEAWGAGGPVAGGTPLASTVVDLIAFRQESTAAGFPAAFTYWGTIETPELSDNLIHVVVMKGPPNRVAIDNYEFTAKNFAPIAFTGGPYTITEGGTVAFQGGASYDPVNASLSVHPNRDPITYLWNFGDGSGITSTKPDTSYTYAKSGEFNATLTVTDPNGVSTTKSVTVTVNNASPVVTFDPIPPAVISYTQPYSISAKFTDPGLQGDAPYAYTIEWGDGQTTPLTAIPVYGTVITGTHSYEPAATPYSVRVMVRDVDGGEGFATTTVTVVNQPPLISQILAPATPYVNTPLSFSVSATDPENRPLTYEWDFGSGFVAGGATVSRTFSSPGTVTFRVRVTDEKGATATSAPQTITVQNRAPTVSGIAFSPSPVLEGGVVTMTGSGSDPDGDSPLTYCWTIIGATSSPGCIEGNASTSRSVGNYGTVTVQLVIKDPHGAASAPFEAQLVVQNVPPVIAPAPGPITASMAGVLSWSGSFTDPGLNTWTGTVNYGDGSGTVALPLSGKTFTLSHSYAPGTYTVTVTISDGKDSDTQTFQVIVPNPNSPPTISNITMSPAAPVEGQTVTFTGVATDPEGDVLTYCWTFSHQSGESCQPAGTATISRSYANSGPYSVSLTVKDAEFSSAAFPRSFTVGNVAPTAVFNSPSGLVQSASFSLSLTNPYDPSPLDLANLQYAFDCGSGTFSALSGNSSASCSAQFSGSRTVRGKVSDGEDETIYTATVVTAIGTGTGTFEVQPQAIRLNDRGSGTLTAQVTSADVGGIDVTRIDPASVRLFDPQIPSLPSFTGNPAFGQPVDLRNNGSWDVQLSTQGGQRALLMFDRDTMIRDGFLRPTTTTLMIRGEAHQRPGVRGRGWDRPGDSLIAGSVRDNTAPPAHRREGRFAFRGRENPVPRALRADPPPISWQPRSHLHPRALPRPTHYIRVRSANRTYPPDP